MQVVDMSVGGVKRRVYVERWLDTNTANARTYVGSAVVSGKLRINAVGAKRFTPMGVNARLIKS